jgi:hypothetical protein
MEQINQTLLGDYTNLQKLVTAWQQVTERERKKFCEQMSLNPGHEGALTDDFVVYWFEEEESETV